MLFSFNLLAQKNQIRMDKNLEIATFANGCFWCTEAIFQQLKGVRKVLPGYIGGDVKNPDYKDGVWAVVDFDYGKIDAPMKIKYKRINVTIPSHLLKRIDHYTQDKHLSRSAFITQATVNAMANTK